MLYSFPLVPFLAFGLDKRWISLPFLPGLLHLIYVMQLEAHVCLYTMTVGGDG